MARKARKGDVVFIVGWGDVVGRVIEANDEDIYLEHPFSLSVQILDTLDKVLRKMTEALNTRLRDARKKAVQAVEKAF